MLTVCWHTEQFLSLPKTTEYYAVEYVKAAKKRRVGTCENSAKITPRD